MVITHASSVILAIVSNNKAYGCTHPSWLVLLPGLNSHHPVLITCNIQKGVEGLVHEVCKISITTVQYALHIQYCATDYAVTAYTYMQCYAQGSSIMAKKGLKIAASVRISLSAEADITQAHFNEHIVVSTENHNVVLHCFGTTI